ncbi:hypothetical protein [Streptomyces litmocidini]|uniref:hypothetical protein n=1 Tax=Streptomyces litmocidini TaxID=67318 RepID=UPI0036F9C3B7
MNRPRVPVRLLAGESLPGIAEALGNMDGRLLLDGAHRLVTRHGGVITAGRVAADPSRVLADRATWARPAADGSRTYCSPLPDGALTVSGRQAVTVHEADGTVRWEHRHRDRQHAPDASGACTPDPAGHVLLATTAGPLGPDGSYAGGVCRALDPVTGEVLAPFAFGGLAALRGEWTDADVVRITAANVVLQREVRSLTAGRERLTKRLSAARDNARFADRRIAALEAQIAEQLTVPPAWGPSFGSCRAHGA